MSKNKQKIGQIINLLKLKGPNQMALDEKLLNESIKSKEFHASFRFYEWEGTWLSLGKNQKIIPKHWIALKDKGILRIVHRPTGGNAVLHSGGLTYSLIWPSDRNGKSKNYFTHCQWLINGFSDLGMPLKFGNNPQDNLLMNCFSSSTKADLVDINGEKRVGSAQLWKDKHLLQHGEILLDPPIDLWKEVFGHNPPEAAPNFIPRNNLVNNLLKSFLSFYSDISWHNKTISQAELKAISIESKKYLNY